MRDDDSRTTRGDTLVCVRHWRTRVLVAQPANLCTAPHSGVRHRFGQPTRRVASADSAPALNATPPERSKGVSRCPCECRSENGHMAKRNAPGTCLSVYEMVTNTRHGGTCFRVLGVFDSVLTVNTSLVPSTLFVPFALCALFAPQVDPCLPKRADVDDAVCDRDTSVTSHCEHKNRRTTPTRPQRETLER